ncbi:MAG: uroporphyrinogen decarboxylase family protein [Bacillota bacterium]|nr:uroporphyrinogen decarboxylase family protein [Bacillota bacterium]
MNSYERVLAALSMQPVDRTPVCPFVMAFAAKFAQVPYGSYCTDYRKMAQAQMAVVERFGYDIVTADTDAYREAEACGALIEFPQDDLPIEKKQAIVDKKDLLKLKLPVIQDSVRLADKVAGVAELNRLGGGEVPVLGWIEGPYQSAAIMRGLTEFMMDSVEDESFVNELLQFTTELAINFGVAQAEAGAHIIGIGDAVASLISPRNYESYVLSHTKRVVEALQSKGAKVKYHICGDASHLLDYIKELGVDLVNIDSKVDLATARSTLSNVCIKGNLNPSDILLKGSEAKVLTEAKKCIEIGGLGYMLSPGCEVPKDTPQENFNALVRAAKLVAAGEI